MHVCLEYPGLIKDINSALATISLENDNVILSFARNNIFDHGIYGIKTLGKKWIIRKISKNQFVLQSYIVMSFRFRGK